MAGTGQRRSFLLSSELDCFNTFWDKKPPQQKYYYRSI
jgi:hypothetical protein